MTTQSKYMQSQQARNMRIATEAATEFAKRQQQGPAPLELSAMTLDPSMVADTSDGTLLGKRVKNGDDLNVTIPGWPEGVPAGDLPSTVTLYIEADGEKKKEVGTITVPAPFDQNDTLDTTVPNKEFRAEKNYQLSYDVTTWNGENSNSVASPIIVDITDPNKDAYPAAILVGSNEITDDTLAASSGVLECEIPIYADQKPGDKVIVWWGKAPLPDDPDDLPQPALGPVTVPANRKISLPEDVIRATGDGECAAVYVLVDKARNDSRISYIKNFKVALGALPDNLQPPRVPQADSKGWVDLQDAQDGIYVAIDSYENPKAGDRIAVTWGTSKLDYSPEVGDNSKFPIEICVPNSIVKQEYGAGSGAQVTDVSYKVIRSSIEFVPANQGTVNVDLSVVGPDIDPWPGPVNDNLELAKVFGATSGLENELNRNDAGQPGKLKLKPYTPINVGEKIYFFWKDTEVVEARTIVTQAMIDDDEITADIPWSYILATDNITVPVFYEIGSDTSPNRQRSNNTDVIVDAITLEPDAPTFPTVQANNILNCKSLNPDMSLSVDVPDLSRYADNNHELTITLSWKVYDSRLPNMGSEITAAAKTEMVTLTQANITGYQWKVEPYMDHILPVYMAKRSGRAEITYSFVRGSEKITSLTGNAVVAMWNAEGSCPVTTP